MTKTKGWQPRPKARRRSSIHTRLWNEEDMEETRAVSSGEMSHRVACSTYHVPWATLQTRIDGKVTLNAKPGRSPRFTEQQERQLVNYACNRANMGIGLGKKLFMIYATQYVKKYGNNQEPSHQESSTRCIYLILLNVLRSLFCVLTLG